MKTRLPIFLYFIMQVFFACNRHDEILQKPPVKEDPAVIAKEVRKTVPPVSIDSLAKDSTAVIDTARVVKDSTQVIIDSVQINVDSAFYRFAHLKDLPYRILFPQNYDSTKSYPLLIFLHGIGESGVDNKAQLEWGSSLFLNDSIRNKYQSFVVFPQCPKSQYWFDPWGVSMLKELIDNLVGNYAINKNKILIGGLSMGAYGTYALVANNPDLFAAAVAISGDGDASKASEMVKTKWRIFAGKKDEVVPSDKSEKMALALKNSGASVAITLYPNADHKGSWVNAFAEPDFCSWLFSSSKGDGAH